MGTPVPGERGGRVAGVVLAAGTSSRMGRNKLLLPWGRVSVLRHAVGTATAAGLDPLLVVLGHESERALAALDGLPCIPLRNPDYALGINTSLRTGFSAVPEDCAAGVHLLADMPFVTAAMLRTLVERFRSGSASLVLSTYGGLVAPPTLYGRDLFPELRALEGDGCGRRVMKRHRAGALEVEWPVSAMADLDEPADVERARARLERS